MQDIESNLRVESKYNSNRKRGQNSGEGTAVGARQGSISWISKMPPMSARQTVLHAVRLFICGRARNWAIVAREKSRPVRAFDWIPAGGKKKFQFRRRVLRGATAHVTTASRIKVKYWTASPDHKSASEVGANYGSLSRRKSGYTFGGVNERNGYFELT